MGEGVNLPRADVVINFDLHYNPVRLIQRDGRAIRINNPKKITIYNFEPDDRIDKELELCERLAERVDNIVSTIGLDFLIWSIEEGKLEEISERNRKRTIELIREYRHELASKHPEELGKRVLPKLSEEDKALREFIKLWNISEESLSRAKTYRKPIFTSLKIESSPSYFIVFKYRGGMHILGKLLFSPNRLELRLSKSEIERIKSMIAEKCLELDREFLKISYRRDRLTNKIVRILNEREELNEIFKDIDIPVLPKKDKERILKILMKLEKLPPWKKEEEINNLRRLLEETVKPRGYQKSLEEPKLLAVIKYG